jgi:YesN/AraC family two-component response regulator
MTTIPKVMIADDEENVREVLSMIASTFNFEIVAEVTDGKEAVKQFRKTKPDILFLDINMPFLYGDEVLEELKDEIQNTCVIMLTAFSDMDNVKKCMQLGATYFIKKDTSVPKIASIIKETWQRFNDSRKKIQNLPDIKEVISEIKNDNVLNKYY